jgi:hypothetical protein
MTKSKGPPRDKIKELYGRNPNEKITETLIDDISKMLLVGMYPDTAAEAVGISLPTYVKWLKKGLDEEYRGTLYEMFADKVKSACATSEYRDLVRIEEGSKTDWRAAAWRRERRNPKRWGRQERIEIDHSGNIDLKQTALSMTSEERRARIKELQQYLLSGGCEILELPEEAIDREDAPEWDMEDDPLF